MIYGTGNGVLHYWRSSSYRSDLARNCGTASTDCESRRCPHRTAFVPLVVSRCYVRSIRHQKLTLSDAFIVLEYRLRWWLGCYRCFANTKVHHPAPVLRHLCASLQPFFLLSIAISSAAVFHAAEGEASSMGLFNGA